jgi:hypothetical protein
MPQTTLNLLNVNSRPKRCEKCGCLAPFVEPSAPAAKHELHEIALRKETINFMARLREITHCEIVNAKAVYAHITTKRGICHWCGKQIPVVEYTDCAECKSFNIWWGEEL